jgi:hypothetical protein
LLLAKIADLLEEPDHGAASLETPSPADDHTALVARVDAGLPSEGVVRELAWMPPEPAPAEERPASAAPLIERSRLETMIDELFEEFGAASFTSAWQQDPRGLLDAAVAFLAEVNLLRPVPGGVLVLPAAFRYRNITLALAETRQMPLDLPSGGATP